jgi:hypothetical protein
MKTYRLAEFKGLIASEFYFTFCILCFFFFLYFYIFFLYFLYFFFFKICSLFRSVPYGSLCSGGDGYGYVMDYGLIVIWYEEVRSCVQNVQEVILILLTIQVFFYELLYIYIKKQIKLNEMDK